MHTTQEGKPPFMCVRVSVSSEVCGGVSVWLCACLEILPHAEHVRDVRHLHTQTHREREGDLCKCVTGTNQVNVFECVLERTALQLRVGGQLQCTHHKPATQRIHTHSDTEVCPHISREHGASVVRHAVCMPLEQLSVVINHLYNHTHTHTHAHTHIWVTKGPCHECV